MEILSEEKLPEGRIEVNEISAVQMQTSFIMMNNKSQGYMGRKQPWVV